MSMLNWQPLKMTPAQKFTSTRNDSEQKFCVVPSGVRSFYSDLSLYWLLWLASYQIQPSVIITELILSLMLLVSGGLIRLTNFHDFLIIITWLATLGKLENHTAYSSGDSFITVTYIPFDIERSKSSHYRGLCSFDRCEPIDWHRKWTDVARSKWCWKRSC